MARPERFELPTTWFVVRENRIRVHPHASEITIYQSDIVRSDAHKRALFRSHCPKIVPRKAVGDTRDFLVAFDDHDLPVVIEQEVGMQESERRFSSPSLVAVYHR